MELYYKHKSRTIVDDKDNVITTDQARADIEEGKVADMNGAMVTLADHDFDMEAVAEYYEQCI